MPDNRDNLNRDKKMDAENRGNPQGQTEHGQQHEKGQGQRTPGRNIEDDFSSGQQGGVRGSQRSDQGEDREREQPGSKQRDQNR